MPWCNAMDPSPPPPTPYCVTQFMSDPLCESPYSEGVFEFCSILPHPQTCFILFDRPPLSFQLKFGHYSRRSEVQGYSKDP